MSEFVRDLNGKMIMARRNTNAIAEAFSAVNEKLEALADRLEAGEADKEKVAVMGALTDRLDKQIIATIAEGFDSIMTELAAIKAKLETGGQAMPALTGYVAAVKSGDATPPSAKALEELAADQADVTNNVRPLTAREKAVIESANARGETPVVVHVRPNIESIESAIEDLTTRLERLEEGVPSIASIEDIYEQLTTRLNYLEKGISAEEADKLDGEADAGEADKVDAGE